MLLIDSKATEYSIHLPKIFSGCDGDFNTYVLVNSHLLAFSHTGTLDGFLKAHIAKFRYGTVTTEQWKQFLLEYFHKEVKLYKTKAYRSECNLHTG